MRLAFNLAIDRNEIIREGFLGYADQVPALAPPWAFDFPEDLSPIPYEPNRAYQLFKETGWKVGRVLSIARPKKYERDARIISSKIHEVMQIAVKVFVISPEEEVKWKRVIAEKKAVPNWDIFLADATTLFYEATPAFFHREFFGSDGALRSSPEIPEFDKLFEVMTAQTDQKKLLEASKEIDRYTYREALGLFICSPQELYAVNKHVVFKPYRTTFELADTEIAEKHWSRRAIV